MYELVTSKFLNNFKLKILIKKSIFFLKFFVQTEKNFRNTQLAYVYFPISAINHLTHSVYEVDSIVCQPHCLWIYFIQYSINYVPITILLQTQAAEHISIAFDAHCSATCIIFWYVLAVTLLLTYLQTHTSVHNTHVHSSIWMHSTTVLKLESREQKRHVA